MYQAAGGFDFGLHVGEHPLNGLKFADGFAEGFALLGVFHGLFERALRQSHSLRGDTDAPAIERAESNLQALTFGTEPIFCRHFAIVQNNFDGRRTALAHLVFMTAYFESRESRLD